MTLLDNRRFSATVVGSDAGTDIAVLKVQEPHLADMPLGDSSHLEVGDWVVAIGNPFGLQHTVTVGIVSALGRTGINPHGYEDFIQTDASINPGNSGGALVNLQGELIGINSAILSSRDGGNIGIGFAIPVNMVKAVMQQLITYGAVKRGALGIKLGELSAAQAASARLTDAHGVLVVAVAHSSAAERAGIKAGDIVVSIEGVASRARRSCATPSLCGGWGIGRAARAAQGIDPLRLGTDHKRRGRRLNRAHRLRSL